MAPMACWTIPPADGRRSACSSATCASNARGSLPISAGTRLSMVADTPSPPNDSLYSLQPTNPSSAVIFKKSKARPPASAWRCSNAAIFTLQLTRHMLGHPHVEYRGRAVADRFQAALNSWANLVRIGDFLAIGAAGGGLAGVIRARVEPAAGHVLGLGGVTLGIAAQDLGRTRRVAAVIGDDEQHGRIVEPGCPGDDLRVAEHPRAVAAAAHDLL